MPTFQLQASIASKLQEHGWVLPAECYSIEEVGEAVTQVLCTKFKMEVEYINQGYCFIWAWLCSLYSNEIQLVSHEDHACIEFQGTLFDSYSTILPEFNQDMVVQEPVQFAAYWINNGVYIDTWDWMPLAMLEKQALDTLQQCIAESIDYPQGKDILCYLKDNYGQQVSNKT